MTTSLTEAFKSSTKRCNTGHLYYLFIRGLHINWSTLYCGCCCTSWIKPHIFTGPCLFFSLLWAIWSGNLARPESSYLEWLNKAQHLQRQLAARVQQRLKAETTTNLKSSGVTPRRHVYCPHSKKCFFVCFFTSRCSKVCARQFSDTLCGWAQSWRGACRSTVPEGPTHLQRMELTERGL